MIFKVKNDIMLYVSEFWCIHKLIEYKDMEETVISMYAVLSISIKSR